MADGFDAYYRWLGIPPKDQPPNHYRLLGVELFETNADVIDHAADRQMTHVRGFQTGQHSVLSQKLLTELSAARLCLLTAEKKAAYDSQLRARLPDAPPISAIASVSPPGVPQALSAIAVVAPVAPPSTWPNERRIQPLAGPGKRRTIRSSAGPVRLWLVGTGGAALVLFAVGLIYWSIMGAQLATSPGINSDRPDARVAHYGAARRAPATVVPRKQTTSPPATDEAARSPQREAWISRDASYHVSSGGEGVLDLPSLLTEDDPDREYAMHTKGGEAGAHIVIDLGVTRKVTRLEIVNRRAPELHYRAKGMQLWLAPALPGNASNPDPAFGSAAWTADEGLAEYQVRLDQPVIARYIKLGFPSDRIEFLHLAKVRVYGH